ncbi:MAG: hypothetical protein KC731_10860 [Myxococcales bacterium]|nr:hypothetical protein [Myxococcales bacterium]
MATAAKRPRFWVPGVLWVDEERVLRVGRHVGYNGHGKAFEKARLAHAAGLRDLRHRIWLVERKDLDPEIVDEHAIILPETLLDPDQLPHARRWLAEQPLVCIAGGKRQRLIDAGLRVYTVEHGVEKQGWLVVSAAGGERAEWTLSGSLASFAPRDLVAAAKDADLGTPLLPPEVRELADRVLAAASRGVLREAAVLNALAARMLVEPGYGYRGAESGTAATIDAVQHKVRGIDALFAQIYERAVPMRAEAREIARTVAGASENDEGIELPVYGGAHRVLLEGYEVALADDEGAEGARPTFVAVGEYRETLLIPTQVHWVVDRVSMWTPKLSEDLEQELTTEIQLRRPPPAYVAWSLVGVLIAIVLLGLLLGEPP